MSEPLIDIEGERFGQWLCLKYAGYRKRSRTSYWLCRCDCGLEKEVSSRSLRNGTSTRCASCSARAQNAEARRRRAEELNLEGCESNSLVPLGGYLSNPSLLADTECPYCFAVTDA